MRLEIKLLGVLEVRRQDRPVALPASKRSRALLGYLVATARPHLRQTLTELLWDGPDDPRAALRWTLAKLRPLVDEVKVPRLVADRVQVAFEQKGAIIDALDQKAELGPGIAVGPDAFGARLERVELAVLQRAAGRFRGEFLEGLELPNCLHYHAWCRGERAAWRRERVAILAELARRSTDLEEGLSYARARIAIDPTDEPAHVALMRLLATLGRKRELIEQYETCKHIIETELGRKASPELEVARIEGLRVVSSGTRPSSPPNPPALAPVTPAEAARRSVLALATAVSAPFVGRAEERERLRSSIQHMMNAGAEGVMLVTGEPGIGKTRLLQEAQALVRAAGGASLYGRAFEAEMVRPYGPFIDAMRSAPAGTFPAKARPWLAPLVPDLEDEGLLTVGPDAFGARHVRRTQIFDGVCRALSALAAERPVVVALDDVHWFDEGAAALLHYLARSLRGSRVLLVAAARPGELADNAVATRLFRALQREEAVREVALGPLDFASTAALVASVSLAVAPETIFAESQGNPLFALEVTRSIAEGRTGLHGTIAAVIDERLARFAGPTGELLSWAAALGRPFDVETLATLAGREPLEVLAAVETFERGSVLRAVAGSGNTAYDFVHDLVRQGAYQSASEPRRRLIHREIARRLARMPDREGALAAEVAHHADLSDDHRLCVESSLAAGKRCLRLSAFVEATALAHRAVNHVAHLDDETRIASHLTLLRLLIQGDALPRERLRDIEDTTYRLAREAEERGLSTIAARGIWEIAVMQYRSGHPSRALERSAEQAKTASSADDETRARSLASYARCLLIVDGDATAAEAQTREAADLADRLGMAINDVIWAEGMLHRHAGQLDDAAGELARALSGVEDGSYDLISCLTCLVMTEMERGAYRRALDVVAELLDRSSKMGEASERPFGLALQALARRALGESEGDQAFEGAIARLRELDSRAMLAYTLIVAAEFDLAAGLAASAQARAAEALEAARVVDRPSEMAMARSLLARIALAGGDQQAARAAIEPIFDHLAPSRRLSARARAALLGIAGTLGMPITTLATTARTTLGA